MNECRPETPGSGPDGPTAKSDRTDKSLSSRSLPDPVPDTATSDAETGNPVPSGDIVASQASSEDTSSEQPPSDGLAEEMLEFMEELRREYMAEFQDVIKECDALISAHDVRGLGGIGHRLKGNGVSFGFPRVSEIGGRMEDAGKADDFETSVECVDMLRVIQGEFEELNEAASSSSS